MRIPGGLLIRPHAKIVGFEGRKMTLLRSVIQHGDLPLRAGGSHLSTDCEYLSNGKSDLVGSIGADAVAS